MRWIDVTTATLRLPALGYRQQRYVPFARGEINERQVAMMCAFSIAPLGAGESVGVFVAEIVRLVKDSGLDHETNAMFTNVSGEPDAVFALLARCVAYADERQLRVTITAKFDHRPGSNATLTSKRERVERLLAQDQ
jgi:uncharacterized protein YqgV (UPF0045/DUF77 family)